MAESDSGEKTEDATQARRDDFRKRGQVAQSKEVGSLFIIVLSIGAMWFLSKLLLAQVVEIFDRSFTEFIVTAARNGDWLPAFRYTVGKVFLIVGPFMGVIFLFAFASSALQIGFLVNEEALKFDLKRIDPLQGFKRIFSLKSLVEGIKAVLKVSIVGGIAYLVFRGEILSLAKVAFYSVEQMMIYIGDVTIKLFFGVAFFMFALAAFDFGYQKWDLEQKMKMSKQEVKEEHKSREGDPMIKARIRRVQREMATRRMMEDVPKADVIITNPTHIAIALKYSAVMAAPTVIAKGADHVAEKIKELAKEHRVPIVENKPLARTMFKTLKIGQMIPRELFSAVAEVLSYIYRMKNKRKG